MAHPICNKLDKAEGKKTTPCNSKCKNWHFSHLEIACVLSEVYSVAKGEPCYIFEEKEQPELGDGVSIVRRNLMDREGYSPYCGNIDCRKTPRTMFDDEQFICLSCGWVSKFPKTFIEEYKGKWGL